MLTDNIIFLRNYNNQTRDKLKELENSADNGFIQNELSKKEYLTMKVNIDGGFQYIHSKYDPMKEVEVLFEKYNKEIEEDYDHIFFYGIGLGYHIEYFMEKFNRLTFSIYEPNPAVLYNFMCHKQLRNLPVERMKHLYLETSMEDRKQFLSLFANEYVEGKILFVVLPSYIRIFQSEYQQFIKDFEETVKNRKQHIQTNYAFEKLWTLNSLINFPQVISTSNILMDNGKEIFKDKTALLIAAGPSLDDELDNLRFIKENKLAYLFTVGSAINTLVENGIYPDAACTYDPKPENKQVFKKLIDNNISEIPLIFGSSVGYETLQEYKGQKIHMLTSQDTVSAYYLKENNNPLEYVNDAASIAVVTLQLLYKLGFKHIILVGQNLAFRDKKRYATGIDYHQEVITEGEEKSGIIIRDVNGQDTITNESFYKMKQQFEAYINTFKDVQIINTTKDGAEIEGTVYIPLEKVIKERLKNEGIDSNWLNAYKGNFYSRDLLKKKASQMEEEQLKFNQILHRIEQTINYIPTLVKNRNMKQLDVEYRQIDELLTKILDNIYSKVFIQPMIRTFLELFQLDLKKMSVEKNHAIKAEKIKSNFGKLLEHIHSANHIITPLMAEVHNMIKEKMNITNKTTPANLISTPQKLNEALDEVGKNIFNNPEVTILYNVKGLFSKQYRKNNIFNRMDVIVRYLAIEDYYGKNNVGFSLYKKMQEKRGQTLHNIERFKKLIQSIEKNGFNTESSIIVDQNMALLDGSHRLACALYFGVENIPIEIQLNNSNIEYSIDWFRDNGFTEEETRIIIEKQKELVLTNGISFLCVLWSPVQEYFEEITEYLRREFAILAINEYQFKNEKEYRNIVKALYESDDIEDWKIEKKLTFMKGYPHQIRVISIELGDPFFRKKLLNGKPISQVVEKIKRDIRGIYSKKIKKYHYDIIIHIGDNFEHTVHMNNVLTNYNPHPVVCLNNKLLVNEVNFRYIKELEFIMDKHKFTTEDFIIVGSSVLEFNGVRQANDIDIVLKPNIRKKITSSKNAIKLSAHVEIVGEGWARLLNIDDGELINNLKYYTKVDRYKFVRLELLYLIKAIRNREKDRKDVRLIDSRINSKNLKWDESLLLYLKNSIISSSLKG